MCPGTVRLVAVVLCALCIGGANEAKSQEQATAAANEQNPAVEIDDYQEVAAHHIGTRHNLRLVTKDSNAFFTGVQLLLIVDKEGNVLSAVVERSPAEAAAAALAEAKSWKYQPFESDGQPVVAKIHDYVRVLPPEDLPKEHREFPRLASTAGIVMTLKRTACYGACPAYELEVHGDGTVIYRGEGSVVVEGEHRDHISPEQVEELVDSFRKADYFSLKDDYSSLVTDCPTFETSFQVDQVLKKVHDYVGEAAGMPQAVSDLEASMYRIAGTAKWIAGNADTVPSLKREHWDFKSSEAAKTMARAAEMGRSVLVQDLLLEGTGVASSQTDESGFSVLAGAAFAGDRSMLDSLIKAGVGKDDVQAKTSALAAAAGLGDMQMVRELIAYGGDPKGQNKGERGTSTVLMEAAASGVPEVVATILAGGPDVNAKDGQGRNALWYLSGASGSYDKKRHADRAHVVHLLAKAGMNLNSQDEHGDVALHHAYEEDVAKALIEDGADVNIRNVRGETPLMTNFSAAVAKLLVAGGADVHAKNPNGKTALDLANEFAPAGDKAKFLQSIESAKAESPTKP